MWDEQCAGEAANDCADACTECAANDCCQVHEPGGCTRSACEDCVCETDGPCCSGGVWDQQCSNEAATTCADACACTVTAPCAGDCDNDGQVTVNNLITAVNIALGNASLDTCTAIDTDGSGDVTVNELIQAVNAALNGCPA